MTVAVRPKDPRRSAQGRAAMRSRWGPLRVVRLNSLPPEVASVIRYLVAGAEQAQREALTDPTSDLD